MKDVSISANTATEWYFPFAADMPGMLSSPPASFALSLILVPDGSVHWFTLSEAGARDSCH
jgi:hypothetical protein